LNQLKNDDKDLAELEKNFIDFIENYD